VEDQRALLGHRRAIAVDAVDDDGADAMGVDELACAVRKLARRNLCGVDLLDEERALSRRCKRTAN